MKKCCQDRKNYISNGTHNSVVETDNNKNVVFKSKRYAHCKVCGAKLTIDQQATVQERKGDGRCKSKE